MTRDRLAERYRAYIDCLNRQDWARLGDFVHDRVRYNDVQIGLDGYLRMLEGDFLAIPTCASRSNACSSIRRASPAACTSTAHPAAGCSASRSTASGYASPRTSSTNSKTSASPASGR